MSKESELAASMAAHELAIAAGQAWKRKAQRLQSVLKEVYDWLGSRGAPPLIGQDAIEEKIEKELAQ